MTKRCNTIQAREFLVEMAPRLKSYLYMFVGSREDAEDVMQDVFIKYMEKGPRTDDPDVEGWLFTVGRNHALNLIRGKRRRRRREQSYVRPTRDSEWADPAERASKKEALTRISGCLQKLPVAMRELVYLKVVEKFSFTELAERTDMPRSSAAAKVQQGLIQLNRCFHGMEK